MPTIGGRWQGWPTPGELERPPERLVLHWTAGTHRAGSHELLRYHALVEHREGDPSDPSDDSVRMVQGVPVSRNCGTVEFPPAHEDPEAGYAAHVRLFNSGSIGLAACAMRGAVDRRPEGSVDPGPSPLTRVQVGALVKRSVEFLSTYDLRPIDDRLMTHREVETLHGVEQPGKWDVTWLPFSDLGPDEVGPWLREQVRRAMDGEPWGAELRTPDEAEDPRGHGETMTG